MFKISVCDDYKEERKELCALIEEYFEQECMAYAISAYQNAQGIMDEIAAGKQSDIYILDIIMPGMDGMELAGYIRKYNKKCIIVFVTFSKDYAIHGYKVEALDYIVKPVDRDGLFDTLSRIIARMANAGSLAIKIKNKTGYMELKTDEIMYAESCGHTVYFGMRDGSSRSTVASLSQYAPFLTKYKMFLRCHKSYIVNLDYVKEKGNDFFLLTNGKSINISRSKKEICRKKYHGYLFDKIGWE